MTILIKKYLKNLFLSMFVLTSISAVSQSLSEHDSPTLTRTIPPSPNAAALGKYGEYPVNFSTGLPSISVPIHEAKSGDLSLPISLSYHSGGFKVEEIASWVGLGWSLNAGGVITRTVRGIADERDNLSSHGNYRENVTLTNSSASDVTKKALYAAAELGHADLEADIYHFNFGNYSGKFYMDADPANPSVLIPQLKPKKGLDISYDRTGTEVTRWIITTENGAKYVFGKSLDGTRDGIERNNSYSACRGDVGNLSLGQASDIASSWFLIEVLSPSGFAIDLFYIDHSYDFRTFGSETAYYLVPGTSQFAQGQGINASLPCQDRFNECYVRNQISGKRLSHINYQNGSIEFEVSQNYRADYCQNQALEKIYVYNNDQNQYLKRFDLTQGYFKRPSDPQPPVSTTSCGSANTDTGTEYRLKLESVAEVGSDGTIKPPHIFTYEESQHLPPRLPHNGLTSSPTSYAQDHWGYYNGQHNNKRDGNGPSTLIPSFYESFNMYGQNITFPKEGADRTANGNFSKSYVIKEIQFPTGGSTSFEFEANTISSEQIPDSYHQFSVVDKWAGPYTFASDNTPGAFETYPVFTVNSGFELNGVQGAYVETLLNENATLPGECGDGTVLVAGEWAVNRYIYDANDPTIVYHNLAHGSSTFFPNGTYYVKLERKAFGYNCHSEFGISLKFEEEAGGTGPFEDVEAGGLRVKQITSYDGTDHTNDLINTFDYQRLGDPNLSSGYMVNFPEYGWKFYREEHVVPTNNTMETFSCPYFLRQSFSFYPLATSGGGVVGYENVTVYSGGNSAAGKTEYTYTTAKNFGDTFVFLAPANSMDWRRGLLLKQTDYKEENGVYSIVKEDVFDYARVGPETSSGLKVVISEKLAYGEKHRLLKYYQTSTEWQYQSYKNSKSNFWNNGSRWLETEQNFIYSGDHFQLTESQTSNSDGSETITRLTYPWDINHTGQLPASPVDEDGKALRALIDQHILNAVIEKQVFRKDGLTESLIGGQVQMYKVQGNGNVLPNTQYTIETSSPIAGTTPVDYVANTGIEFDAAYQSRIVYDRFDDLGNVLQYTTRDGITTSFIWGYYSEYPVAKIVGATYDEALSALGTAFDATTLVNNLTDNQTDDLRAGLTTAFVTIYEYEPGRGLVAQWDPNGNITRYEYDDLGRLFRIRDKLDNVLKQYEYNYANQND